MEREPRPWGRLILRVAHFTLATALVLITGSLVRDSVDLTPAPHTLWILYVFGLAGYTLVSLKFSEFRAIRVCSIVIAGILVSVILGGFLGIEAVQYVTLRLGLPLTFLLFLGGGMSALWIIGLRRLRPHLD